MRRPLAALYDLQRRPRRRWLGTALAMLLGIGLGSVHWLGLVIGGALVGLCWPTFRRALLAGLGFGLSVVCVFLARHAFAGTLTSVLDAGPLLAIAVLTPLVAGPFGAAIRGLVPEEAT